MGAPARASARDGFENTPNQSAQARCVNLGRQMKTPTITGFFSLDGFIYVQAPRG